MRKPICFLDLYFANPDGNHISGISPRILCFLARVLAGLILIHGPEFFVFDDSWFSLVSCAVDGGDIKRKILQAHSA